VVELQARPDHFVLQLAKQDRHVDRQ
jgi:hypothetical protein